MTHIQAMDVALTAVTAAGVGTASFWLGRGARQSLMAAAGVLAVVLAEFEMFRHFGI